MVNFIYNTPTKVVFGRGVEKQVGELVKAQKATKVLVHYGSERTRESGLLELVANSLKEQGIEYLELGGVVPNPHLSLVREGIRLCRAEGVDFILPVGGGSVIDSGKAIAYGAANEEDVWSFFEGTAVPTAALPVGAVVTLAAAGSEMSDSCVITDEQNGKKYGLNNDLGRCRFAVMNPELTLSVPAYPTACGCADIMMHTLERYFTGEKTMEITDGIAESLLRTVIENSQILTRHPESYEARAEIMWAGALSHNGLTGCGGGRGDWACHQLGHEISAKYNVAHGASLTSIWGCWAQYVYKQNPARFARLAVEVLDLPHEGTEEQLALAAIEEMDGIFWGLDMPTSFKDLGIKPNARDISEMVEGASRAGKRTLGSFRVLGKADMENIYEMASQKE
ncbi:MAG: iron-containing alcohol dehydrogenase [Oscillospiraceae bacterium]